MPPKRACDTCISRKVKCNGSWPCDTCRDAIKRVPCTYLKPPRRRGPKVKRAVREDRELLQPSISPDITLPLMSKHVLAHIIRLYRQYSYSVWPIINVDALLDQIDDIHPENTTHEQTSIACLVTALCAATMAQLQLAPVTDSSSKNNQSVDSTILAQSCLQLRARFHQSGDDLDLNGIVVSFFLHVYHAKVNQCTASWFYIQEAISGAKILRLDQVLPTQPGQPQNSPIIKNSGLLFPLLWISERGYAMHLGLSSSCIDPPSLAGLEHHGSDDNHVKGLLDLSNLFIAFDQISIRHKTRGESASATHLTETEERLCSLRLNLADQISTRSADCHITREWMRTILWQEALSLGLLSSSASTDVMTFSFPTKVSRNLLNSLRLFSEADLLPLGRDQLLKCFEVANSLADTALLISTRPDQSSGLQLAPKDFLHALYQKISPFLEQDPMLNSILRAKTAELLVIAPARLLTVGTNSTTARADIMTIIDEQEIEENVWNEKARSIGGLYLDFMNC